MNYIVLTKLNYIVLNYIVLTRLIIHMQNYLLYSTSSINYILLTRSNNSERNIKPFTEPENIRNSR